MSKVAEALSRLTPEQKALLEKKLQQKRAAKVSIASNKPDKIQPRPDDVGYPLSAGQERLWMLSQFEPEAATYNITEVVRLRGSLNILALEKSIAQTVERHESLRAIFQEVDGQPSQMIIPAGAPGLLAAETLSITKLHELSSGSIGSGATSDGPLTLVRQFANKQGSRPFYLDQGPLFRFGLLELGENDHVLILTMHHIITDAWSFGVLFKELSNRYKAIIDAEGSSNLQVEFSQHDEPNEVPPLAIQYADFAHWQQEWLKSESAEKQLGYWKERLAPGVESLRLPTTQAAKQSAVHNGAATKKILPSDLVDALQQTSRNAGVTLFITLLAGFKTTLHRYTGQEDLIVCSPTAGRKQVETEELIGYFNNIVSIRTDLSNNPDLSQIQGQIQESLVGAYDHDELPFQQVASLPHLARIPLTRALFTLQDGLNKSLSLPGIDIESVDCGSSTSDFDIALYMEWLSDELVASLEYKTNILDESAANALLENLCETLQQIAANPTIHLNEFTKLALAPDGATPLNQPVEQTTSTQGPFTSNGSNLTNGTTAELSTAALEPEDKSDPSLPPSELEQKLIRIWEETLDLQGIKRTDNFFELGGHSMSAIRLFSQIEKEITKERLPLALLFQAPTVAKIAKALGNDDSKAAWSLIVPLQAEGSKPPLFCIHAAGGNVLLYRDLARHLSESDQPVYGIQSQGLDGKKPILNTVEEMAAVYVKEIQAVQPSGPYLLLGYCLGGTIAVDVAQRLMAQGHTVAFLGLLETYNWANLQGSSLLGTLKFQSQRAEFMVRNFMMLDSNQRQDFFRGKMERIQGRTSIWRGALQARLGKNAADRDPSNAKSQDAVLAKLWETNDIAADSYVPTSYPGKITQFVPMKDYTDYSDPKLSWHDIAQGGVEVFKLPVYPAGMVYEPFVGKLATYITDCIESSLKSD